MKPTVPEVAPIVRALYAKSGAGCCWHIVLDDFNVTDDDVRWVIEEWMPSAQCVAPEECRKLADLLPKMTKTQRRKLALTHGDPS